MSWCMWYEKRLKISVFLLYRQFYLSSISCSHESCTKIFFIASIALNHEIQITYCYFEKLIRRMWTTFFWYVYHKTQYQDLLFSTMSIVNQKRTNKKQLLKYNQLKHNCFYWWDWCDWYWQFKVEKVNAHLKIIDTKPNIHWNHLKWLKAPTIHSRCINY